MVADRNSPNNSRSFDEPYFQFNANGGSSSGLLPTDRPNTLKADAYYQFKWLHNFTTNLGLFQYFYQGSPNTTYANVGYSENAFPVKLFDWGKWANITQDSSTGAVTVGNPFTYRNPWYNETDFSFSQSYNIGEAKSLNFQSTFTNLLNEHAVTAVNSQVDWGLLRYPVHHSWWQSGLQWHSVLCCGNRSVQRAGVAQRCAYRWPVVE